jgi:signal transduction histidine kinase
MLKESSLEAKPRAWVEVDLGALVRNARALERRARNRLLPMIKADAYGLGALPVARALEALDPVGYGVSSIAEGSELRRGGITRPILIFTPTLEADLERLLAAGLTPTLASPEEGEADEGRLAQVVTNLVGNALQHSPPGTPVRVSTRGVDSSLLMEVHNEGPAITAELLPMLFEPYRRGAEAGPGRGSLGLGLYITRQIVLGHGGSVDVCSTPEDGTTFTVRLPRSRPPA